MKRFYIVSILALALFAGCNKDTTGGGDERKLEDSFKELTAIGVYNKSMTGVYLYDEEKAQYAVSAKFNTTRIQNDDKTKYIQIVFDAAPKTGGVVSASITRVGISDVATGEVSLKVIKTESGKVWLMDDQTSVCYLMPWVK